MAVINLAFIQEPCPPEQFFKRNNPSFNESLLVLGIFIFGVIGNISERDRLLDTGSNFLTLYRSELASSFSSLARPSLVSNNSSLWFSIFLLLHAINRYRGPPVAKPL
jgi:hypothetical protein